MYDLKKPCGNCPFRRVGAIYLAPGRLQSIADFLVRKDTNVFDCHKTLGAEVRQICMGSLAYLSKNGHGLPITAKMAISMKMLDFRNIQASIPLVISTDEVNKPRPVYRPRTKRK